MAVYYVYILETLTKNGKNSYYTGYTNNLFRRWNQHRKGSGAKYCRGKKKVELKYFETYTNRKEAMKREVEIKTFSKQKKLELIKNFNKS